MIYIEDENFDTIYKALKESLILNPNSNMTLDITGGKKSMVAAASIFGKDYGCKIVYVDFKEYLKELRKPMPGFWNFKYCIWPISESTRNIFIMKHQIALVGGQLLPIYVGIKEFSPDKIHFIVSKESIESLNNLKPMITGISHSEYRCNAFNFYEIKTVCEKIIQKLNPEDTITFNLTGGTKIMVLASQAIIHEKGLNGFYVNQDDSFLELPSYEKKKY